METKTRLPAHEHPFYLDMGEGHLVFVAHRGGDGGYENTAAAFQSAIDAGVKFIETDIRSTVDGVPVHFHGDKRTKKIIRSTPFRELNTPSVHRQLGISEQDGVYIPALEETLQDFPDTKFFLDLKSDISALPVAKVIKKTQSQERVSIDGHVWKRAVVVSKEVPGISTTVNPVYLHALYAVKKLAQTKKEANSIRMPGLKTLQNRWINRATSLSVPMDRAAPALLAEARALDIPVFLHHVEDMYDIDRASEMEVKGIMADRLDLLGHTAVAGAVRPLRIVA